MESSSDESENEMMEMEERRRPMFRERMNWEGFSTAVFKEQFRCTPQHAEILLQLIGPQLQPKYFSNHALTAKEKLLVGLRFFADNDDYHAVGCAERIFFLPILIICHKLVDVSKPTVCRVVRQVCAAVICRLHTLIAWPNNEEACRRIGQQFFQLRNPGLPSVCGAIDGSLINIVAPSENEFQFVDRKSNHSINAMAVAGYI